MALDTPATRPANPRFSSGPCAKIPTYSLDALQDAALGRSHRASIGKTKLKAAIEETRDLLGVPADYRIGIVPASDTGAFEMAMWSLLGAAKPVDNVLVGKSFGKGWATDIAQAAEAEGRPRSSTADYGRAAVDLSQADAAHRYRLHLERHHLRRAGCRTGAAIRLGPLRPHPVRRHVRRFCACPCRGSKLDVVTTYSWQKVLGRRRPRTAC